MPMMAGLIHHSEESSLELSGQPYFELYGSVWNSQPYLHWDLSVLRHRYSQCCHIFVWIGQLT